MSHSDTAVKFNESFERCVNDPLFLDRFYVIFLASSDEVKLKFKDTDMETQKTMLATSMVYMTSASNKQSTLLAKIADKHNMSNFNIQPSLYPLWLVCVLKVTNMPEGYNGQHFSSGKKASSDIKS